MRYIRGAVSKEEELQAIKQNKYHCEKCWKIRVHCYLYKDEENDKIVVKVLCGQHRPHEY